ncbi:ENTH-domain-containing protein [Lentinus tigrinus ALCF2SS1-7]|uniref:ENTH-domain-containing protein n=1 Tax=Lentinus tigrinus ALCF2SS1-6 TaxID=1328759 RepID=A0A5C2RW43_9APHY|nr:ENTH-domain-containing protein [Lentinus tigrinus ALCF2SS1-6]RPD69385.1 ENTH-domain-containing protein [Lentinus tigrinus ALCF2SS1-7]
MAAVQTFGKSALRAAKNYSKGYSHTQIKVRNATCNDPWPPSGKEMYELAQMTYNELDFVDIMEIIDKRLNDKGKNWRHVFKALVVLDYLLHSGSENVIVYCEENLYEIKTLREFQYIDDEGIDQGANVRHKAADITNLLTDRQRLHRERRDRAHMRDRLMGRSRNSNDTDSDEERPLGDRYRRRPLPNGLDKVANGEDEDLRRAIEESKKSAAMAKKTAEDQDLERAIKLSQEDEERRKKLVEQNAAALFDDSNQLPSPATQQLIDASLPLQYAIGLQPQYTAIQPQFTSIQPQFTSIQPQYTSFNPYLQAAQQEAMQAEYMRQQAEYAQLQQLQAQQTAVPTGYYPQQPEAPQSQPLVPQMTSFGSNNPFLPHSPEPPTLTGAGPLPSSDVSFNLSGTYEGRSPPPRARSELPRQDIRASTNADALLRPFSTGWEPPRRGREREDARLAALFANYTGDGVDTFGNIGQLRFGQTQFGRLAAQKTGTAGSNGEPSHNPFLSPPHQSPQPQQQSQGQERNLIDI